MLCGKATVSPANSNADLIPIRLNGYNIEQRNPESPKETYSVDVLQNSAGEKIYKCPICKSVSGTEAPTNPSNISLFAHNYNCPNINKIPIEK